MSLPPQAKAVEIQINYRRGKKREHLAKHEAADDGNAQRTAEFRADAIVDDKRQRAEHGGKSGHHNGAEAQEARLINSLGGD